MRRSIPLLALAVASGTPAMAATRTYTVTSFERIRVAGPFSVRLRTGLGASAKAVGDADALDRLKVEVQGDALVIGVDRSQGGWRDMGGLVIEVTTPSLRMATLSGSGGLAVDRARADRFDAMLTGSGALTIGSLQADRLTLSITGSGGAIVAGKAAQARIVAQGSGAVDAHALTVADADVGLTGSGDVSVAASRSAKVVATGSGDVIITGAPACTVRATGSGEVRCGPHRP